jgi:hypothetical protein
MRRTLRVLPALIVALAACSDPPGAPRSSAPTSVRTDDTDADEGALKVGQLPAAVTWNETARSLVVKYSTGAVPAARVYALTSLAQYNASVSDLPARLGCRRASRRAAVAAGAATVLTFIYPAEASSLQAMVDAQAAESDCDPAAGDAAGRAVGASVVAYAKTDGFVAVWSGTVPTGAGFWFSSLVPPQPPLLPLFGQAKPYFMTSGSQFRAAPPPAFGSPEHTQALAEVRHISDTRTAEQDSIAKFWALPAGTIAPSGYWNARAAELVAKQIHSEQRAAHTFALISMTGYDALIACFDSKYTYWSIRPIQADPLITLSVAMPNFPSYPSGHACISGAQSTVIGALFPAVRWEFRAMAEQAALSRLYGGIHYRFDDDTGLAMGRAVARQALQSDVDIGQPFVLK